MNVIIQTTIFVPIRTLVISTDTVAELIDKTTGSIVETKTITATSGAQGVLLQQQSGGKLVGKSDTTAGAGSGPDKTDQPFIQTGYKVG